jgi:hypothetical protein
MSGLPCGGRVEYLHRSFTSRRRRRKGKSRIWDSKIWSRVPWDSDSRMTALARASSNCKRQIRPLVRESVPHQMPDSNKNLVVSPRWTLYSETEYPTDRRSLHKTRLIMTCLVSRSGSVNANTVTECYICPYSVCTFWNEYWIAMLFIKRL